MSVIYNLNIYNISYIYIYKISVKQQFYIAKFDLAFSLFSHQTKCVIWISFYKYGFQLFYCISALVHCFMINSILAGAQVEGGQILLGPQTHTIITGQFIHQGEYSIHFHSPPNISPPLLHYLFVYLEKWSNLFVFISSLKLSLLCCNSTIQEYR